MNTPDLSKLPLYQCHKIVRALKIKTIEPLPYLEGGAKITPVEEGFPPFKVQPALFARYQPVAGDYWVVYEDDYASFSPAKAFEEGYTRI